MFRNVAYVYHVHKQKSDRVLAIYCNVCTRGRHFFQALRLTVGIVILMLVHLSSVQSEAKA